MNDTTKFKSSLEAGELEEVLARIEERKVRIQERNRNFRGILYTTGALIATCILVKGAPANIESVQTDTGTPSITQTTCNHECGTKHITKHIDTYVAGDYIDNSKHQENNVGDVEGDVKFVLNGVSEVRTKDRDWTFSGTDGKNRWTATTGGSGSSTTTGNRQVVTETKVVERDRETLVQVPGPIVKVPGPTIVAPGPDVNIDINIDNENNQTNNQENNQNQNNDQSQENNQSNQNNPGSGNDTGGGNNGGGTETPPPAEGCPDGQNDTPRDEDNVNVSGDGDIISDNTVYENHESSSIDQGNVNVPGDGDVISDETVYETHVSSLRINIMNWINTKIAPIDHSAFDGVKNWFASKVSAVDHTVSTERVKVRS